MTAPTLNTSHSQAIFSAAQSLMPGGVSSPVRAFKSVGGQPIVFDRVKGPYAWDVDGNKYIDYIGSWGPAICGHAHPEVISALQEAIEKGTSFGAPCALENTLAEMVIEASITISARVFSRAHGAPKLVPFSIASWSALITSGWAWPQMAGPQLPM